MKNSTEEIKNALRASLYSLDLMTHVLSTHFVSEETAELRRYLDDKASSTFHADKYSWKSMRAAIDKWLDMDLSNGFLQEILKTETIADPGTTIGPLPVSIGVQFPLFGNKQQCRYIGIVAHTFRREDTGQLSVRIKSVYPVPTKDYFAKTPNTRG